MNEELSEDSADKVVCTYCEMLDGHCDNCPLVGKKKGKICRSCLVGGQEPSKKPSKEDCSLGNCPFYPYSNSSWGMSPDGWARAKENHDRNHNQGEI